MYTCYVAMVFFNDIGNTTPEDIACVCAYGEPPLIILIVIFMDGNGRETMAMVYGEWGIVHHQGMRLRWYTLYVGMTLTHLLALINENSQHRVLGANMGGARSQTSMVE